MKNHNRSNRVSLQELMANETPGGRGLLAAEIVQKTGREHGPIDGRCEVCGELGQDVEIWLLQDWIHWHCEACAIAASRAEWAEMAEAVA